jgi:iron(III) transport system substrate-binding protein
VGNLFSGLYRWKPWSLSLAGVLLLALMACGGPAANNSPGSGADNPPGNGNQAGDPGKLTIYSGRSDTLVDPIIQQFAVASGIDVEVKYAGTPQLAATILEEGRNSPADLFFAQDPGGLGAVEHMLAPLPEDVLNRVPEWARSPEGKWVGISGRARTVVYNTERLTEADLPDDVMGFTDPQWRGRIGWAPTNASFQTMVTGMRAMWGEEQTRQWLEGIQANNPRVYSNNTAQVVAAAAGEIDVGLVNHYYLYRFLAEEGEGFPARNYHPRAGGPGAMIMVAGAGILSTSRNPENAERFLAFMLSTVGQQYFTSQTYEYPLVEGVQAERLLVPFDQINNPGIPLRELTDLEGTQTLMRQAGILP